MGAFQGEGWLGEMGASFPTQACTELDFEVGKGCILESEKKGGSGGAD